MNLFLPEPVIIDVDVDPEPPPPSPDLAVLMDDLAQQIAQTALDAQSLDAKIDAFKVLTAFYLGNKKVKSKGEVEKSTFGTFKDNIHGADSEEND